MGQRRARQHTHTHTHTDDRYTSFYIDCNSFFFLLGLRLRRLRSLACRLVWGWYSGAGTVGTVGLEHVYVWQGFCALRTRGWSPIRELVAAAVAYSQSAFLHVIA